jgi:O-acetylserine/cysteine efflux transporter
MHARHFLLMILICVVWALNTIISKIVVADLSVPPLFYALMRSAVVALAVCPWLFPMPKPRGRVIAVAILMGGGGFALSFIGMKTASPSAVAIVLQIGVPVTALLSVVLLRERITMIRGIGMSVTLVGVLVVMWDPGGLSASTGLLFIAASAVTGALGTVMLKQINDARPIQLQAWVGFASLFPLMAMSTAFESHQISLAGQAGWIFIAAIAFSGLVVSVLAHTAYYSLIQRYEANLIASLTLMNPLFTILLGVMLTGDRFDLKMGIGTGLALLGVLAVALGPKDDLRGMRRNPLPVRSNGKTVRRVSFANESD